MQNLLRWTKTGFCLLLHTPHFVRSACLTNYNLFQGVLKEVCGVINRVKDITLNRQDCSTDFYFSYPKSNILASTPSQAPFKAIAERITKMWVGRDFWRSSKRIFFSEQDHLLTLDHGSLDFAWKAESIKPPRMEMPQPLWGWKAKALYVMMYSHEKEGRKCSLYGENWCSRWDWFCKANPLNMTFCKLEQNHNRLPQKGPY